MLDLGHQGERRVLERQCTQRRSNYNRKGRENGFSWVSQARCLLGKEEKEDFQRKKGNEPGGKETENNPGERKIAGIGLHVIHSPGKRYPSSEESVPRKSASAFVL